MQCIHCASEQVIKYGTKTLQTGQVLQQYLCKACGRRFNERSGTPMSRLRTPVETVSMAIKVRSEGLGIRATARVIGKAASSIITWEEHLSAQLKKWSPPAPNNSDITLEGDELYTRVGENLPPL
jgi:transposase-like protein